MNLNAYRLAINTLVSSLRTRGLIKTVRLALGEFRFDRRYGLDTSGFLAPHDMETASTAVDSAQPYMPTASLTFDEILGNLDHDLREGIFIDFGSGKGRVVLLAALSSFKKVIGVEFDRMLCATARENLAALRRSSGADVTVEIVQADVLDFEIPDETSVFYFFNPFTDRVMESVLGRIRASLEHKPRRHAVVYMNPVCHDLFAKTGFRLLSRHESSVGQIFHLYSV